MKSSIAPKSELLGNAETIYLLHSRANAKRLLEAIADTKAGRNLERIDLDDLRKRIEVVVKK